MVLKIGSDKLDMNQNFITDSNRIYLPGHSTFSPKFELQIS